MNVDQLNKQIGTFVKLRPVPMRVGPLGEILPKRDDDWQIQNIMNKPNRVCLSNISTGHYVELGADNVREYRTPNFLLLRCQLIIKATGISIEPLILS